MANTYTQLYFHIIFSTKNRDRCIRPDQREDLYAYIWGVHKNLDCHLYRIGGVEDHIHLLTSLHPTLALSKYVEAIKASSTNWIRRENIFPTWPGWQDGYGAFTAAHDDKEALIEYIKTQEEHHKTVSFIEEYQELLKQAAVPYDAKYLV